MELKKIINSYKDEMINNLKTLVSYNTVLSMKKENAPFGVENARCLDAVLKMAESYGLKTKNLDGYCGYVEIGEGKEVVGVLTHLDIVPAGNGWDSDPFKAIIKDNKIYGRGTSDDKGAVVASLIALKILNDSNIKLNKRVRLIIGCNEETDSKCMEYYVKKEGNIDIGFTPDGNFPVVHGEKGRISLKFKCMNDSSFHISGGVVVNAVSDNCKVEIKKAEYNRLLLEKYLKENNIEYKISNVLDKDIIEVKGISAHASTPELGKSAISYAIMALKESGYNNNLIDFYSRYIGLEIDGKSFGIGCCDTYGVLTFVNGKIWTEDNEVIGTIDIRVPVTINPSDICNNISLSKYDSAEIQIMECIQPLYYPIDSEIVTTLMKVYQDVTGDLKSQPITIGGGTYAKTMNNCLSFGCAFPNTNNAIHNANEFVDIDELLLQVELYFNAILGLVNIKKAI